MPRSARQRRPRGAVVAAALTTAGVMLAGCGDDPDAGVPAFDGAPSAGVDGTGGAADPAARSTPAAVDDAGEARLGVVRERPAEGKAQQVYDAYVAFWRADLKALADPSKGPGAVTDLAVDPQRRRTLADLAQMRTAGTHSAGTLTIAPVAGTVEGGRAQLRDCLDDTALATVDAQGKAVPGSEGKRVSLVVTMKLVDDAWVVANIAGGGTSC